MHNRRISPWLYPLGRYVIMPVLRRQYRLKVVNAELFEKLRPPYVVVGNHSTFYDGFYLASGIRGYHIEPKWSREKRDGSITVEYRFVAGAEEIAAKTVDEVTGLVQSAITHDDFAHIHDNGLSFPSKRGAEYLERVLYHCPECDALAALCSRKNTLECGSRGAEWLWAGRGILYRQSVDGAPKTAESVTIREWTEVI